MSILNKIGGESGKANGSKILEPLVLAIFEPKMLNRISWTGRAASGKAKKIAISKYSNILRLITNLCEKADSTYKSEECLYDLKYKIIKYAHAKYGETNAEPGSVNGNILVS